MSLLDPVLLTHTHTHIKKQRPLVFLPPPRDSSTHPSPPWKGCRRGGCKQLQSSEVK